MNKLEADPTGSALLCPFLAFSTNGLFFDNIYARILSGLLYIFGGIHMTHQEILSKARQILHETDK